MDVKKDVNSQVRAVIKNCALFSGFDNAEFEHFLQIWELGFHQRGKHIYRAGDESNNMMVLLSGSAVVQVGDSYMHLLRPGDVIGEIGFVLGEFRSADVAVSQTGAAEFSEVAYDPLRAYLQAYPLTALKFHLNISKILAAKLNTTTQRIARLQAV